MRLVLQGVGDRFDVFYDRLWKPDEVKQTGFYWESFDSRIY